jgi:hypothetical protein
MSGNVRINSMKLNTTANLGDPQPLVINYARLEGNKNKSRSKVGYGGSSISKTIMIRLQRDTAASTTITGCYAVEMSSDSDTGSGNEDLNKEFCDNLGTGTDKLYKWDSTRNACVMNGVCDDGQVFEGIDSTGQKICRSINDYLPYLIQPSSSPCSGTKTSVKLVLDPVTNKVSIECEAAATCTPQAGSSTPTPTIDEDCNGVMDNTVYTSAAWYNYMYKKIWTGPGCTGTFTWGPDSYGPQNYGFTDAWDAIWNGWACVYTTCGGPTGICACDGPTSTTETCNAANGQDGYTTYY